MPTENQLKKVTEIIKYDSNIAFQKFMDEEIAAQPDCPFFKQFKESELVSGIFLRGYMEGLTSVHADRNTKYIAEE